MSSPINNYKQKIESENIFLSITSLKTFIVMVNWKKRRDWNVVFLSASLLRPQMTHTSCSSTPSTTTTQRSSRETTSTSRLCVATPSITWCGNPTGKTWSEWTSGDLFVFYLNDLRPLSDTISFLTRVCFDRTITLNTEDGNFSVSMLLYKDEAFEDRWTTVPSLSLEDDIFVKVFMVNTHVSY